MIAVKISKENTNEILFVLMPKASTLKKVKTDLLAGISDREIVIEKLSLEVVAQLNGYELAKDLIEKDGMPYAVIY